MMGTAIAGVASYPEVFPGMTERGQLLEELRSGAFAIAYRMLGSVSEAEDLVQEALLRVHQALEAGEQIHSPRSFVATITIRLAITELRSARMRREQYSGDWLPEPIVTGSEGDPAQRAETTDSLSFAMLLLLERLSPEQRAVFLLHDVFGYTFQEIAGIIGKSEANVRQIGSRARRHVDQDRSRFEPTREQRNELVNRFFAATEQGDIAGLETLLARDVVMIGDGGGKVPALGRSLHGCEPVARMMILGWRLVARLPGVSMRRVELNGEPGVMLLDDQQRLLAVLVLGMRDGQIAHIGSVNNPDKLAHLGPVGNVKSLLAEIR